MESLTMVKSGQVTFAVRDTVMNDVEVKEGNIIQVQQKVNLWMLEIAQMK